MLRLRLPGLPPPCMLAHCRCLLAILLIGSVRSACLEGWHVQKLESSRWLMGAAYAAAAVYTTPTRVEALVTCIMLSRFLLVSLMGFGLVRAMLGAERCPCAAACVAA